VLGTVNTSFDVPGKAIMALDIKSTRRTPGAMVCAAAGFCGQGCRLAKGTIIICPLAATAIRSLPARLAAAISGGGGYGPGGRNDRVAIGRKEAKSNSMTASV